MSSANYRRSAMGSVARARGWAVTDESARTCECSPPHCSAAYARDAELAKVNRRMMRSRGSEIGIVPGQSRLRFDNRPRQCDQYGGARPRPGRATPDPDAGHEAFPAGLPWHRLLGRQARPR